MRRHRLLTIVTSIVLAATALAATEVAAREHTASRAALSERVIAVMSAPAQARLLQPLRRLADALDAAGRRKFIATYTGVQLDATARRVMLYATDLTAARRLVAAVRRTRLDRGTPVVVLRSDFSRARLDAAVSRLVGADRADRLVSLSPAVDGSAVIAQVRAGTTFAAPVSLGVPIRIEDTAATRAAKSWADVKWHDHIPFIGGDVITTAGQHYCTTGLPVVRVRDKHPLMITAAHCFGVGQRVFTAGGRTGAYGNGLVGSYVGTVTARVQEWDAAVVDGADNNADESDTTGWKPLTSAAYSYDGDYVCQDGQASFFLGHPTPCGIKVTDDDIWFRIAGYWARGVEGIDVAHQWGSHNGDSGATVFATEPNGTRQARGIVSSGGQDGTPDQRRVDWTEAPDIFHYYGVELNPRT